MSEELTLDQEAAALCEKLSDLDLSERQRELLDAILLIASTVSQEQDDFDKEFENCFEPGQAARILKYQHSSTVHVVGKQFGPSIITNMIITRP